MSRKNWTLYDSQGFQMRSKLEQFDEWKKDRDEALLSLDIEKVRAYMLKWGEVPIKDDFIMTGAMHKAITGCESYPLETRQKSKDWLTKNGFKSLDDGDLK